MKRKQERKICIVFLLMALLASALAGCGAKGSQNTDIPPTVTATPTISAVENGKLLRRKIPVMRCSLVPHRR